MLLQTAKTIGDRLHVAHERAMVGLRRLPLASIIVFGVAIAWLAGAGWWNYIRPQEFDLKSYERYREQLADCRELSTSEARYDCVAQALIGRDQTNFGKTIVVFLPSLSLIMGYYLWREVQAGRREREHARLAEQLARRQVSKFRQEMRKELADATAHNANENTMHEHAHGPHAALLNHVRPVPPRHP
jgi:uncharacterized protein HemX